MDVVEVLPAGRRRPKLAVNDTLHKKITSNLTNVKYNELFEGKGHKGMYGSQVDLLYWFLVIRYK